MRQGKEMRKFREKWLAGRIMMMVFLGETLGGGLAFAADDTAVMDEYSLTDVVVTATRTPVEEFKSNANVTVVTAEEIAKNHYSDLSQALRNVPGVTVNQYSQAGYDNSNGLYINGSDSVVIMVDGVRQNFAGGNSAALATTMKDLSNIERIEVLRGSASTLYGADAKGGVINIITKKQDKNKTTLHAEAGSYGRQKYSMANEGYQNGWNWRLFYEKDKSNDFKDAHGVKTPSELDADSLNFKLSKELNKESSLTFDIHSYKDDDRYMSLWDAALSSGKIDKNDWHLIYDWNINSETKNQFVLGHSKYYSRAGSYVNDIKTWHITDQFDKHLGDHLLTAGFEFTQDKSDTSQLSNKTLTNRSYYLQDQWDITKAVKLTAGIRHDNNSAFGSHNSPSVNIGYEFNHDTNMYVSYSEYFLTPSPMNLFSAKYGNPNLKPESGNTKEIGLNHRFDSSFTGSIHYFKRYSKNRIGYLYSTRHYANVGTEDAHGWDIQLKKKFDDHVSSSLSYTHTNIDATAQRAANIDGYIPLGEWKLGVTYTNKGFDALLNVRGIVDRMGPQTTDVLGHFFPATTYWVLDLAFDYQVSKETKVFLRLNNIFNQYYAEHSNARSQWGGSEGQWWTAPGRNFMAGVEYSF